MSGREWSSEDARLMLNYRGPLSAADHATSEKRQYVNRESLILVQVHLIVHADLVKDEFDQLTKKKVRRQIEKRFQLEKKRLEVYKDEISSMIDKRLTDPEVQRALGTAAATGTGAIAGTAGTASAARSTTAAAAAAVRIAAVAAAAAAVPIAAASTAGTARTPTAAAVAAAAVRNAAAAFASYTNSNASSGGPPTQMPPVYSSSMDIDSAAQIQAPPNHALTPAEKRAATAARILDENKRVMAQKLVQQALSTSAEGAGSFTDDGRFIADDTTSATARKKGKGKGMGKGKAKAKQVDPVESFLPDTWSCVACTFVQIGGIQCAMCETRRIEGVPHTTTQAQAPTGDVNFRARLAAGGVPLTAAEEREQAVASLEAKGDMHGKTGGHGGRGNRGNCGGRDGQSGRTVNPNGQEVVVCRVCQEGYVEINARICQKCSSSFPKHMQKLKARPNPNPSVRRNIGLDHIVPVPDAVQRDAKAAADVATAAYQDMHGDDSNNELATQAARTAAFKQAMKCPGITPVQAAAVAAKVAAESIVQAIAQQAPIPTLGNPFAAPDRSLTTLASTQTARNKRFAHARTVGGAMSTSVSRAAEERARALAKLAVAERSKAESFQRAFQRAAQAAKATEEAKAATTAGSSKGPMYISNRSQGGELSLPNGRDASNHGALFQQLKSAAAAITSSSSAAASAAARRSTEGPAGSSVEETSIAKKPKFREAKWSGKKPTSCICSTLDLTMNPAIDVSSTESGYMGVGNWFQQGSAPKYTAQYYIHNKTITLGKWACITCAALAVDAEAKRLGRPTNFVRQDLPPPPPMVQPQRPLPALHTKARGQPPLKSRAIHPYGVGGGGVDGAAREIADGEQHEQMAQFAKYLVDNTSVQTWTVNDVCLWATCEHEVEISVETLRKYSVSGIVLLQLDCEMLEELGVDTKVKRQAHLAVVKQLYEKQGLKVIGMTASGLKLFGMK